MKSISFLFPLTPWNAESNLNSGTDSNLSNKEVQSRKNVSDATRFIQINTGKHWIGIISHIQHSIFLFQNAISVVNNNDHGKKQAQVMIYRTVWETESQWRQYRNRKSIAAKYFLLLLKNEPSMIDGVQSIPSVFPFFFRSRLSEHATHRQDFTLFGEVLFHRI